MAASSAGRGARSTDDGVVPNGSWRLVAEPRIAETLVLALDTSTKVGGVALVRGASVLAEEVWQAGGNQTTQVLPEAMRMLDRAGVTPADLGAVAVATGPGSFTGLRVAASLGKGFAAALQIPLLGIPTLDAVAAQHRDAGAQLCAVVEAGRGQLYAALYRTVGGRLKRAGEYLVQSPEELLATVEGSGRTTYLCGEIATLVATLRGQAPLKSLRVASPAATLRRPAFLAELALWRLSVGHAGDSAAVQPIYLRRTSSEGPAAW